MLIQRSLVMALSIALLGLGMAGAEETMKSGQGKFDKQMSPEGNAMGVPVPGSTKDIESTEKQPDTSKIQSSKTLDRLPNSIEGAILKIDGENYEIQGNMGDRVRLIVNNDTRTYLKIEKRYSKGHHLCEVHDIDRDISKEISTLFMANTHRAKLFSHRQTILR